VTAAVICEGCFLDSKRNGICTEPACDRYGVKQ
jgi:hypothetical protein